MPGRTPSVLPIPFLQSFSRKSNGKHFLRHTFPANYRDLKHLGLARKLKKRIPKEFQAPRQLKTMALAAHFFSNGKSHPDPHKVKTLNVTTLL